MYRAIFNENSTCRPGPRSQPRKQDLWILQSLIVVEPEDEPKAAKRRTEQQASGGPEEAGLQARLVRDDDRAKGDARAVVIEHRHPQPRADPFNVSCVEGKERMRKEREP